MYCLEDVPGWAFLQDNPINSMLDILNQWLIRHISDYHLRLWETIENSGSPETREIQ